MYRYYLHRLVHTTQASKRLHMTLCIGVHAVKRTSLQTPAWHHYQSTVSTAPPVQHEQHGNFFICLRCPYFHVFPVTCDLHPIFVLCYVYRASFFGARCFRPFWFAQCARCLLRGCKRLHRSVLLNGCITEATTTCRAQVLLVRPPLPAPEQPAAWHLQPFFSTDIAASSGRLDPILHRRHSMQCRRAKSDLAHTLDVLSNNKYGAARFEGSKWW